MDYPSHILDESSTINPLLQFCHDFMQAIDQLLLAETEIGVSQFRVMQTIRDNPRCAQQDLATALNQTEASISRQLKVLRQQGFVTVHKRIEDGRARSVILTPQGQDKLLQATDILSQRCSQIWSQFPKAQRLI